MTKSEARKMARLEAENAELRATLDRVQSRNMDMIREACAYRVMFGEIAESMAAAKEMAQCAVRGVAVSNAGIHRVAEGRPVE